MIPKRRSTFRKAKPPNFPEHEARTAKRPGIRSNLYTMEEASQIALITAGASIAGGFVGQFLSILYTGRVNQLERVRMVEARSAQLYLREIEAYDQLVPGLAGLLYVARGLTREPLMRQPRQHDAEAKKAYKRIQDQIRDALSTHFQATAEHYHVIGPQAIEKIDAEARNMISMINEMTATVGDGEPVTAERADAIWEELEEMRHRVLEFCWESLDVTHLESSFRKLKEPLHRESVRLPSILDVDLRGDDEERQRV